MLANASNLQADVEIRTSDGRVLTGAVDSRTTADTLWIRQESDSIILATPVSWAAIAAVTVEGKPMDVAQLSESSAQLVSETRFGFLAEYEPKVSIRKVDERLVPIGRVTNIEIEAVLVNLDRDVEPDGYEVAIAVVDEYGHEVPVEGSLYARLEGERNVHHTGRIRFEVFETWTQPVAPHDFVDGVAMYVLPFRAFAPEFDDELRPAAQLDVRLGVFGQGNYASTVPVPLWYYSEFRDRMQMFAGSRFFRNELTSRVRHYKNDQPGIYRKPWSW